MNVYISVDMEGCAGVVHREQTNPAGYDYEVGRMAMTREANAAVAGAFEAGATRVVVSDSHGGNGMRNIRLTDLDPRAELISGTPRRLGQLECIDQGFDALLLVGYHTRHGRGGVLSHTMNGQAVADLWVNGRIVGEIGINAYLAGSFGVPTVLVSGDDLTVAEGLEYCPGCEGAVIKWALGRYSARHLPSAAACDLIHQAAVRGLKRRHEIMAAATTTPLTVRIRYKESGSAESAARMLDVTLLDDDTVEFTARSMAEAYAAYSVVVETYLPAWGSWIKG